MGGWDEEKLLGSTGGSRNRLPSHHGSGGTARWVIFLFLGVMGVYSIYTIFNLTSQINSEREQRSKLVEAQNKYTAQMDSIRVQKEKMIDALGKEKQTLLDEIENLKSQLSEKKNFGDNLHQQLKKAEDDSVKLQQEFDLAKETWSQKELSFQKDKQELQNENESLKEKLAKAEKDATKKVETEKEDDIVRTTKNEMKEEEMKDETTVGRNDNVSHPVGESPQEKLEKIENNVQMARPEIPKSDEIEKDPIIPQMKRPDMRKEEDKMESANDRAYIVKPSKVEENGDEHF